MRKDRVLIALSLVCVLMAGCALFGSNSKSFVDMTPKEKSTYFMSWYNAQYDDAKQMGALAQQGRLTDAQLMVYRAKKDLLTEARPLIGAYDMIVAAGEAPSPEQEQAIMALMNKMVALGGGK